MCVQKSSLLTIYYQDMSILAIGTVAFDDIETPFAKESKVLGGSATYITLAARYFTDAVHLVAVVGNDFPQDYIQLFEERGIGIEGLEIDPNGKTFFWSGRYHLDMNNRDTLVTDLNVLATFDPKVPESYRNSRIVCLGNLHPSIQMNVLDQMENPELVVLDTMNYWMNATPNELNEVLKRIDVLIINDAEARQLSGVSSLVKAAKIIREMGPKTLIIKKGEHGALLFHEDTVFSAPALPLEEVNDPTGAGDTFAGGFVGYLAQAPEINADAFKVAIIYGSVMASYCVGEFGPKSLLHLSHAEIADRFQEFKTLSDIPMISDAILV